MDEKKIVDIKPLPDQCNGLGSELAVKSLPSVNRVEINVNRKQHALNEAGHVFETALEAAKTNNEINVSEVGKAGKIETVKTNKKKHLYDVVRTRVRELMFEEGINSVTQLCKGIGVHQGNTNSFLSNSDGGQQSISLDALYFISKKYHRSLDYFVGNTLTESQLEAAIAIDYFDDIKASAGTGIQNFSEETPTGQYMLPAQLFKHVQNTDDIKCLLVHGYSMTPVFNDGDYIFIDTSQQEIVAEQGIYVIRIEGELFVKGIQKIPGGIRLLSYNTKYLPIDITAEHMQADAISVIGRVVASFSMKNRF